MDNTPNISLKEINAVFPSFQNQFIHCPPNTLAWEIIKQTIAYLNPGQSPVDVCDQPVFALKKESQWRYSEKFGSGPYLCLFGGLHFEQCMLIILGELIKGSDLENILPNIDMSIKENGALPHTNHVKQAGYCLQVSLCALFSTLKDAKEKSGLILCSLEWLEQSLNELLQVFNCNISNTFCCI